MPRTRAAIRPPRYLLDPGVLVYDSLRRAAGLDPISPEARDTYRVILGFSWSNKYQFTPPLTRRTIADERALDERTISRHIAELEAAHYLRIQPGEGQANTYIPLITYQTDSPANNADREHSPSHSPAIEADREHTAHSPADEADRQPGESRSTATAHSPADNADRQPEPLSHMSRVSALDERPAAETPMDSSRKGPLSPVSRVPININSSCSSSLISSEFKPEKQQLLQHINNLLTGTFRVLPHAAGDLVATASPADILGWLHALVEAQVPPDRLPRVLIANLLRDHRPAPPAPPERRAERARREADWGLPMSTEIPGAAESAGQGDADADLDFLADLLAIPRQAALDALWSARAAGWGPRFTQVQIVKWALYASMPSSQSIGSPAHFVAAKIRQAADCPDLPLWKTERHRNRTRVVEDDPVWEQWASEHRGELATLRRLESALDDGDKTDEAEFQLNETEEELP
jgi:hypothetical protein